MTEAINNSSLKILITGASGFIGSHLSQIISNNIPNEFEFFAIVRDKKKFKIKNFKVIEGDLSDIDKCFKEVLEDIDVVIHAGGIPKTKLFLGAKQKREMFNINCEATINLASLANDAGVQKFIFLSSAKVFGENENDKMPFNIEDKPQPDTFYAFTKREAEKKLIALTRTCSMKIHIIRPPKVLGSDDVLNKSLFSLILCLGVPLPVSGLNKNLRSYVKIETLCKAILKLMMDSTTSSSLMTVKEKKDISTLELLELIASNSGNRLRSFYIPPRLIKIFCRLFFLKKLEASLLGNFRLVQGRLNRLF